MDTGRLIGHFEVIEELGAGGMGVVFRARDLILHRDVALKLVHPDRGTPDFHSRFLDEARIAATLTHPGIAAIYEAGDASPPEAPGSQFYVAQELVAGETLAARLARGPLAPAEALDLTRQLLDALGEAHARGIIHRDIKPSNLMVTPAGRLKVLDFGIARRTPLPTETTRLATAITGGTIMGTPSYMAPEQLRGAADARTDLFAAGCVLYELLTGRRLLEEADVAAGALRPSALLRRVRPDVPEPVPAAVDRATAFDPAERFGHARDFARALEGDAARTWPARAAASALAILIVLAAGFAAWRGAQPTLAFEERDWVLVGSLVNDTGDPGFDKALEGALETDLRQSRYVNVFDGGQLASALAMMRLPPDATIDTPTGRAICELAGLRVLLVPRIISAGSAFQLEASLIEPRSGRVVDRLRVTAHSREALLLHGIDEFTRLVRRRLGESLESIADSQPTFIEYATSSWEALRFLRIGGEAIAEPDVAMAARAFEQALEHDPTYPAALASLGLLYIQFLNRAEEGRRLLDTAVEHSSPAADREHIMLRALHKQFVANDPAGALEDYRFVTSLYPDMFQPYNNSGRILIDLRRYAEAAAMFQKAHELDPRHAVPLWNLWELRLNRLDDPEGAEARVRDLEALQPENAWIRHIAAWTHVARRRFDEAEAGTRQVLSLLPLHPYAFPNLGHLLLRRGAALEAAAVYDDLLSKGQSGVLELNQADIALFLGLALADAGRADDGRAVHLAEIERVNRRLAERADTFLEALLAALYAAAGHRVEADRISTAAVSRGPRNPWLLYAAARVRALLDDPEGAADLLRRARAAGYDQPYYILVDPAFRLMQDHPVIDEVAPASTRAAS
jgi:eukaryotic-like serine/threonine-protein kinase